MKNIDDALAALAEIDQTPPEELAKIDKRAAILEQRLATLDGKREKVSPVVFDRVRDDYAAQLSALVDERASLAASARETLGRLRCAREDVSAAIDEARSTVEEIGLRHELKEYTKKQADERIAAASAECEELEAKLAAASDLETVFEDALGSEDPEEERGGGEEPAASASSPSEAAPPPPPQAPPAEPPPVAAAPARADQTVRLPAMNKPNVGATVVLKPSRVTISGGASQGEMVSVGFAGLTVGSAEGNALRLVDAGIEPRHLRIAMTSSGFEVENLSVSAGLRVNGERQSRCRLSDEDRVALGDSGVELIFNS